MTIAQLLAHIGSSSTDASMTSTEEENWNLGFEDTRTRLYHREEERWRLEEALRSSNEEHALVLITGNPGTGKTALARSMEVPFFVEVKNDSLQPFDDFRRVLEAVDQLLEKIGYRESVRYRIESTLDEKADKLLLNALPSLSQLWDIASAKNNDHVTHAQTRLFFSLSKLLSCIATVDEPLVLFMDDMQWAGSATIDFLCFLLSEPRRRGFLVVSSCRSDEMTVDHKFTVVLRELEACGVEILNINVTNFTLDEVEHIVVSAARGIVGEDYHSLSVVIYEQTGGTIFFVLMLLEDIIEQRMLGQCSTTWLFQSAGMGVSDVLSTWNIGAWLSNKVGALSAEVSETLETASCFGGQFRAYHLAVLEPSKCVEQDLLLLRKMRLLERLSGDEWRFRHDLVQQWAYAMIPEQEREKRHLDIGRLLWQAYNEQPDKVDLATVIQQLRLGARLLASQPERYRAASLLLHAGELASASSSFVAAVTYMSLAIDLLGPRHWKDEYFLSLNVFCATAEVEYFIGNFDRALELIDEVISNARNEGDKCRAWMLQISTLGSDHKIPEAIDLSLSVLSKSGVHLPRYFLLPRTLTSIYSTISKLKAMSDADILSLPRMCDEASIASVNIMALLQTVAVHGRPLLCSIVLCKMVNLSLDEGLSSAAAIAFAGLSAIVATKFGYVKLGIRLARLSLAIMDKMGSKQWRARVLLPVHVYSFTWNQPLRLQLKPMLEAHRLALGNGDIEYSLLAAAFYSGMAVHSSIPLQQLRDDVHVFVRLAKLHNQQSAQMFILPWLQLIANLVENSSNPTLLDGEFMTEESFEKSFKEYNNETMREILFSNKMQLCSYFHEYQHGCQAMLQTEKSHRHTLAPHAHIRHYFHAGLCCAMIPKYRRRACRYLRKLRKMADLNESYARNKALLLEAVLDATNGKHVFSKFEESIELARAESLWNEVGLASEHAAKAAERLGQTRHAVFYAKRALEAYQRWGAEAKCALLSTEYGLSTVSALSLVDARSKVSDTIEIDTRRTG